MSWERVDLAPLLYGGRERHKPEVLQRSDGAALLYRGAVNEMHGEPESGKGFIVGVAVDEELDRGGTVVYLDFDADPVAVLDRVLATLPADTDPAAFLRHFHLYCVTEPLAIARNGDMRGFTEESALVLEAIADQSGDTGGLVVIDGVNALMALHGMDPGRLQDVADFLRMFAWPFRSEMVTVLLVDHVTKNADNRGRFAYGSIQKSAALDGASFEIRVKKWPAPGKTGRLQLVVAKDRRGGVRERALRTMKGEDLAADVTISSALDGPVYVTIDPAADPAGWLPTALMQKVSEYLETCPEPASKNNIEHAALGKAEYVRQALNALISQGFVKQEDGPNRSILHSSIKPFRDSDG